jgi:hypothetical protein
MIIVSSRVLLVNQDISIVQLYLDIHLEADSEGRLITKAYDKRDAFNFSVVNFPFICGNIPAAPA